MWEASSLRVEDLGNVGETVEHIELFVAALEQSIVGAGDDLRKASFLQIFHVFRRLHNVVVQKLVEQLLAIIALKDYVLCHSLDVGVGCAPRANHSRCHENRLVRDDAGDAIDVFLTQACLLGEAGARLQGVDAAAKVTISHLDQLLDDRLRLQFDVFGLADAKQTLSLSLFSDGCESEFDTSRGEWVNDLADVVANDAESGRFAVGFDDASEGCLCVHRHRVCLVKDHELELRDFAAVWVPRNFPLRELLHLLSDDRDASLVTRIQLENSLSVEICAKKVLCKRQYSGCLSSSRWPIQQQMWHLPALNRAF